MPVRKHIGFIELIIIICLVVIGVKVWTHKNSEHKVSQQAIGLSSISRPTPPYKVCRKYYQNPCPKCKSKKVALIETIIGFYERHGIICENCGWCSFKCPECGSKDFLFSWVRSIRFNNSHRVEKELPRAYCKKCYWDSLHGCIMVIGPQCPCRK